MTVDKTGLILDWSYHTFEESFQTVDFEVSYEYVRRSDEFVTLSLWYTVNNGMCINNGTNLNSNILGNKKDNLIVFLLKIIQLSLILKFSNKEQTSSSVIIQRFVLTPLIRFWKYF